MAGSKKYFLYSTDSGDTFAILLDESNTEAVNAGSQDYLDSSDVIYTLPGNIRPRRAYYSNAGATRTISCVALTPTIYAGIPANQTTITDPLGTGTLNLVRLRPELIKILPKGEDTGLNDGDAT